MRKSKIDVKICDTWTYDMALQKLVESGTQNKVDTEISQDNNQVIYRLVNTNEFFTLL